MPKDKLLSVRFDAKMLDTLEKLAKTDDRSVGYIIRRAVTEYLRKERP